MVKEGNGRLALQKTPKKNCKYQTREQLDSRNKLINFNQTA